MVQIACHKHEFVSHRIIGDNCPCSVIRDNQNVNDDEPASFLVVIVIGPHWVVRFDC